MKKQILIILIFIPFLIFSQESCFLEANKNNTKDTLVAKLTTTQKLETFTELFGLIRYFHPSDEAASIDWNKFAEYGVDLIQTTQTNEEFDETIKQLFSLIAPSASFEGINYEWGDNKINRVFWMHKGVSHDNKSKEYKSVRINRDEKEGFYAIGTVIRDLKLKSTRIKLSYQAKTQGMAYGYLKLYDKNNKKIFFENHQREPVMADKWISKEIITPQFEDIGKLDIGMITKRDFSYFREIKLFYEDTNQKWRKIPLPKLTNKAWYPIRGAILNREKNTVTVDFDEELKYPIIDKFLTYSTNTSTTISIPSEVYEYKGHTIPVSDSTAFQELKMLVENYQPKNENTSCISNIIISWNIFRHFYPYQDVVKIDWKEILRTGLKNSLDVSNKQEEMLTLRKFTEVFQDGHIRVNPVDDLNLIEKGLYNIPVSFKWAENQLVVDKTLVVDSIGRGDIISKVNDIKVQVFMDSIKQYVSGSPQRKNYKVLVEAFRGEKDSEVKLTLNSGSSVILKRQIQYYKNYSFYSRPEKIDTIKVINKDILYLNLDVLSKENVEEHFEKIAAAEKIILDLRGYPKSGSQELLENFFYSKKDFLPFYIPLVYSPNFQNVKWKQAGWNKLKKHQFNAEIVLLVDERSISYAESTASYLKHNDYVTVVGRPTAGANGNVNKIKLNNGFRLVFTGLKVLRPDGTQFHTLGVIPDFLVKESVDSIKEGKDVFIEKALEILE